MKWIEKYYHIQKKQFDTKDNIDIIYKIALPKVLGLVFSSLAATTLARSLDKRGERRKVVIEFWFQTSDNIYQWDNSFFFSGRFSFSSDPRLGGKGKQWSSTECVKNNYFVALKKSQRGFSYVMLLELYSITLNASSINLSVILQDGWLYLPAEAAS